jgi:hypothetical protein
VNAEPETDYLGAGGTHQAPWNAYEVDGVWDADLSVEAGLDAIISAHCNMRGCSRWDSGYALFSLQTASGTDTEYYAPQTSTMTWYLGGAAYGFSPTAFTAATIDAGTLNATTITGAISGSSIMSGTVSAARLPVFGPSGASHAAGVVPDPGATAGVTRFLREDGTWDAPAGTGGAGGSPTGAASGDLGGTYPAPEVTAVHATGGTLDGVTIGGTTPASVTGSTIQSNSWVFTPNVGSDGNKYVAFGNTTTVGTYQSIVMRRSDAGTTLATFGNSGVTGDQTVTFYGLTSAPGFAEVLTTPASSSAACTAGEFTDDANFHYVCVAANTWKRAALSSF